MKRVLPTADVTGYEEHLPQLTLPDPGDRRVLQHLGRKVGKIPCHYVGSTHHISAQNPDEFLIDLYGAAPQATIAVVENARKNLRKTAPTAAEYIHALKRQKLTRFATLLRLSRQ